MSKKCIGRVINLLGTVEVVGTPAGNILKELFKAGIKLGISSRGMGSVETVNEGLALKGPQKVGDDFELIAFDFVSNPSHHGAFLHPVNEGVVKESISNDKWGKRRTHNTFYS